MKHNPNRPTVQAVIPLLRAIYDRHCAGCCLHIMVDDYNVEQHSADYCLEAAIVREHEDCIIAALMMSQMTMTQRLKAARGWHGSV